MPRVKRSSGDEHSSLFAARLRALMSVPGMNQQKLAEFIGVTRQAVSSYSLGTSLPDVEKLSKIAKFFNVSIEYLLGRTEVMKADAEKQAIAEQLGFSEAAIDKIKALQKDFILEKEITGDGLASAEEQAQLAKIFSLWIEEVDLEELLGNIYRSTAAVAAEKNGGLYSQHYQLPADENVAVENLKQQGYVTLSPSEQQDLYEQKAAKIFGGSVQKVQEHWEDVASGICVGVRNANYDL